MYSDFDIRYSDEYPLGVFCRCGRVIHLKEFEAPAYMNKIVCPYCGNGTFLIRTKKCEGHEINENVQAI